MVSYLQPYLKTKAVVLQVEPVTNTSARVEWLSNTLGRFTTRILGAYRPKSFFLGQFDLFYTCQLVLQQGRGGYLSVRECCPLAARPALRSQWRSMAAASYFSSLFSSWLPYRAASSDAYGLLNRLLDTASRHPGSRSMVFWGELKLLEAAGWSPDLRADRKHRMFNVQTGRLESAAAGKGLPSDQISVSPDAAALLERFQSAESFDPLQTLKLKTTQEDTIENLLGRFLQHQLERALPARQLALDMIGRKLPRT